jgi:hypothetical protein
MVTVSPGLAREALSQASKMARRLKRTLKPVFMIFS